MLRIAPMSDQTGRYLLDDPALEVADLFGGVQRCRWEGASTALQGLGGAVRSVDLSTVLSGRLPFGTLEPSERRRVAAYDLIFAAPKPVSVLFASDEDSVARECVLGHEAAVRSALGYIEDRAAGVMRHRPGAVRSWLHVEGTVAAAFTHGASRSGDPHLHSHLILANRARAEDGRFGALDAMSLRAHGRAADAIYLTVLRAELRERLNLAFLRTVDGSTRIEGISDAACVALSGRAEEVRRGVIGPPPKVSQSRGQALELWTERRRQVVAFDDQPRFARSMDHIDEHRAAAELHDRPVTARSVVESLATAATGGMRVEALRQVLSRAEVPLGRGGAENRLGPGVLPTHRALATLGPRPTDDHELSRWLDEASLIRTHSDRQRPLNVRAR
jgi:conjugative relaxase-like TrwC/TraI family protein